MIVKVSLRLVEAIKLHRTDTTLDLSQKAEKGMRAPCTGRVPVAKLLCLGRPQVWVAASALMFPVAFITQALLPGNGSA